jgi:hypothetical protein
MATETPLPNIFNQEQKDAIRQLVLSTLTNYADVMRIQSGNIESGNFDEINGKGWKMDSNGVIKATEFIDTTYSLNGVFVKLHTTTQTTGTEIVTLLVDKGGLLFTKICVLFDTDFFIEIPSFSFNGFPYYLVEKISGNYSLFINNEEILVDFPGVVKIFVSCYFNSLETGGY